MSENWDDLRYFLALAREGTISAAARTLGVQHTTVSRRIQQLEASYGMRLFERTTTGYLLSAEAAAVLPKAVHAEEAMMALQREMQANDGRIGGVVRVTLPHDLYESVLVEDFARLTQQYPDIELELLVSKGIKNLANREADIAVRFSPKPPDELIGRELLKLRHGIYIAQSLRHRDDIPIILWGSDHARPAWADEYFPHARVALRVDALSSMYQAVAAGMGAAKMPRFYPNCFARNGVVRLSHELLPSDWGVWVLTHQDLRHTPRIQLVKNFIQTAMNAKEHLFIDCLCPLENQ